MRNKTFPIQTIENKTQNFLHWQQLNFEKFIVHLGTKKIKRSELQTICFKKLFSVVVASTQLHVNF